jgi:hypothetical protein
MTQEALLKTSHQNGSHCRTAKRPKERADETTVYSMGNALATIPKSQSSLDWGLCLGRMNRKLWQFLVRNERECFANFFDKAERK